MNWNKPEGMVIHHCQTDSYFIVEQWNWSSAKILFIGWLDFRQFEAESDYKDHTVALWMPKGMKQRKNISNE